MHGRGRREQAVRDLRDPAFGHREAWGTRDLSTPSQETGGDARASSFAICYGLPGPMEAVTMLFAARWPFFDGRVDRL